MAHTPNMQILSFLLQDPQILKYTEPEIQDEINALPPLNSFNTGDAPRRFLYDPTESIIGYANPENPEIATPEYQEILSKEPDYQFPNILIWVVE